MRLTKLTIGLALLTAAPVAGQTNPSGHTCYGWLTPKDQLRPLGGEFRICMETNYTDDFRFFRLRRSSTQSGSYDRIAEQGLGGCWRETTPEFDRLYALVTFPATGPAHLFYTVVSQGPSGSVEGPGSAHYRVRIGRLPVEGGDSGLVKEITNGPTRQPGRRQP